MSLNYGYSHSTSNREGCSFLSLLLYALLLCPCFGAIYSNTSWWLLGFFFLDATNILQKIVSFLPLNIQLSFICKSWLFCSSWYCFHLCFGVSQSQCCKIKLLFLFSYAVSSYLLMNILTQTIFLCYISLSIECCSVEFLCSAAKDLMQKWVVIASSVQTV